MNENGLYMILHSAIIGLVLYAVMKYGMYQKTEVAVDSSILISSAVLMYMILFGHHMPYKLNKNIYTRK